jgi:hypothetical protein
VQYKATGGHVEQFSCGGLGRGGVINPISLDACTDCYAGALRVSGGAASVADFH